jgi:G:T/U-mismatch repair DNA glycosylase/ADP-ribose pyrophosphatase YjhB (NUDIX family)
MSGRARRGAARRPAAADTSAPARPPRPPSGIASDVSTVPDVLAPGRKVVFCGINPGFASAAAGAHFANPRNDFWRLLAAAGLTSRLYEPSEQFDVLEEGIGLTNAAPRTTRGSGDLRRGDFAGAAERLEQLASELQPGWIAFVGKEAYRGTFGQRPELGLQERRLGETQLFVLPSTSPANAAVSWDERERWFQELAGRATGNPLRRAVRGLVVDSAGRVLLTRYDFPDKSVWAPPGGGIEAGETAEDALMRELAEEAGLIDFELGPCIWTRDHWFADMPGWGGQSERIYLVQVEPFRPAPQVDLAAENVAEVRWWSPEELDRADALFAPRGLPTLVRDLLTGPPAEPIDVGV